MYLEPQRELTGPVLVAPLLTSRVRLKSRTTHAQRPQQLQRAAAIQVGSKAIYELVEPRHTFLHKAALDTISGSRYVRCRTEA
jgi:hypothetical protein